MEGIRKLITNSEDIAIAKNYNMQMRAEYAGHPSFPQVKIPEPKYETQRFAFRLNLATNYYVERDSLNGKEDGDVIVNIMYEGVVRFEWDALLIQTLDIAINRM
jgi:hypothetical protein